MKISKYYFTLLLLLTAFVGVAQQSVEIPPVRWRTSVKMTSDNAGVVTFKALVLSGWHLYGFEQPQGGPKPTVFDLSQSVGVEFTADVTPARAPLSVDDPMFGKTVNWWDTNISFTVPFRLTGADAVIKAAITYMTCNGNTCRPPKTERISAAVPANKR